MLCEICGKEVPFTNVVKVEGATLKLCPECTRFGEPVGGTGGNSHGPSTPEERTAAVANLPQRHRRMEERDVFNELPPLELDPDWHKKIRASREARGLTLEAFGNLLSEKSSVVHKLESGEIVPPDALVRKIERVLKIRLRAPPGAS